MGVGGRGVRESSNRCVCLEGESEEYLLSIRTCVQSKALTNKVQL